MSKTTAAKSRTETAGKTASKGKKSTANKAAVKTTTAGKQGRSKPKKITGRKPDAIAAPVRAVEVITGHKLEASDESDVSIVTAPEHNPDSALDDQTVQALNEVPDNSGAEHIAEPADVTSDTEAAPDAEIETPVDAGENQSAQPTAASEHDHKQTPDKRILSGVEDDVEVTTTEIVSVAEPQTKQRSKKAKKEKPDLGERFNQACAEVSRLRKEFLAALDEKAALLGIERKGEGLAIADPEAEGLNAQIKEARQRLDDLLKQKRELYGASPELQEVNARITRLRQEREAARWMKKVAYDEAMKLHESAPEGQEAENGAPGATVAQEGGSDTRSHTYQSDTLNRKVTVPV